MNDLITGTAMGMSQIIVGHPFDTIKVLIQNKQKWYGFPIKNHIIMVGDIHYFFLLYFIVLLFH